MTQDVELVLRLLHKIGEILDAAYLREGKAIKIASKCVVSNATRSYEHTGSVRPSSSGPGPLSMMATSAPYEPPHTAVYIPVMSPSEQAEVTQQQCLTRACG